MQFRKAIALLIFALPACSEGVNGPLDASGAALSTAVPGQEDREVVTGKYTSLYAYDSLGAWYWDLGDGRVYGTVTSPDDLDAATRTGCEYQIIYRGSFGSDAFLDSGWIRNNINCSGFEHGTFNSLIVHRTDERFVETNPTPGWGPDWVYVVDTWSGVGNVLRPSLY